MARSNYKFQKRQKELARQKKKEQKRQNKLDKKKAEANEPDLDVKTDLDPTHDAEADL